eukprot:UN32049
MSGEPSKPVLELAIVESQTNNYYKKAEHIAKSHNVTLWERKNHNDETELVFVNLDTNVVMYDKSICRIRQWNNNDDSQLELQSTIKGKVLVWKGVKNDEQIVWEDGDIWNRITTNLELLGGGAEKGSGVNENRVVHKRGPNPSKNSPVENNDRDRGVPGQAVDVKEETDNEIIIKKKLTYLLE